MKRKALGKGLSALLPDEPPRAEGEALLELPPDRIDPNPEQPRQTMNPEKLDELARSMTEQGVVQPLVVRKQGSRYQLIAGERRWRAAQKAGLAKVPVVVREASDEQILEIALVENIQREELNPIEEAAAYRRLTAELGFSQEQVAAKVGKDRSTVANLVRLLRLPRDVRGLIADHKLSPGHARPLLALETSESQREIALAIVEKGLSVREVERSVKAAQKKPARSKPPRSDANTREAERQLQEALGTTIKIRRRGGNAPRGRIEIEFHSEDELHRIYESILKGARAGKRRRNRKNG